MKIIYEGELQEVELLATGKRFKKDVPVLVTKEEAKLLKNHKDFKLAKSKKGDE
jgi:hypothetical protein